MAQKKQEKAAPPKTEKEWLEREMAGFEPLASIPWHYLSGRYGDRISKEEIISLGQVCSIELNITLVRDYKRRKETMLKWFSDHWDKIQPFLETGLEILDDRRQLGASRAETAGDSAHH
jgi:hypothetical protein